MSKDNFIRSAALLTSQIHYTCPSRPPSRPYKHHLYPASQFSALLTALQARKNENDIRYIQYVVTPQKKILLAQAEGNSAFIPTHKSMAYTNFAQTQAAVLSAGLIFLSPEGKIMGISNESVDFPHLSTESILWVVAGLHVLNVQMEENLSIIPNTPHTMQFILTPQDRQHILEQLPLSVIPTFIEAHRESQVIIHQESNEIMLSKHRDVDLPLVFNCTLEDDRNSANAIDCH